MNAKLSRNIIIILACISLSIFLPNLYWMVFDKPLRTPNISYSPIIKNHVYSQSMGNSDREYFDEQGNSYERKDYMALLPFSYSSDLDIWGLLPDTIDGFPVSITNIRRHSQYVNFRSRYFHTPMIQLNPLFESQSDFTRLEMPDEVFRITDRIEFIDSRTNCIVDSLSKIYSQALAEQEFHYPAKYIAGNPQTRKPFDEGYFIIDAKNSVFHMKQIKGKPFCVNTGIPTDLNIRYIIVQESTRREFYAVLVTWENDVYLISYNDYKLIQVPIKGYNADEMDLMFFVYPTYRSFNYSSDRKSIVVTTDTNYNIIKTYETSWIPKSEWTRSKIAAALFPFQIERENARTDYILFNLKFNGWLALIGIILALCVTIFIKVFIYRENLKENWFDLLLVAATGFYGALAVLLIQPEPWD